MQSGKFRLKVSIKSGKYDPKDLISENQNLLKDKRLTLNINDTKLHTYFILFSCHPCMCNSKMKIERMS